MYGQICSDKMSLGVKAVRKREERERAWRIKRCLVREGKVC